MHQHHTNLSNLESHVREIVASGGPREERLKAIAAEIHAGGGYRWVGIYDVGPSQVRLIAFSGPRAPAHPVFSRDRGLTGRALQEHRTIVVGDVDKDPNYLKTFSSTKSEMIVLAHSENRVAGTIDVESDRLNAFGDEDRNVLERVAALIGPLVAENQDAL